jgi:hypothetical protein
MAVLLPRLGERWLLGHGVRDGSVDGAKLASLVLHLACVEVRLSMEEPPSAVRDAKAAAVLPAASRVIEAFVVALAAPAAQPPPLSAYLATTTLAGESAPLPARLSALPPDMLLQWQQVLQTTFLAVLAMVRDWQVRAAACAAVHLSAWRRLTDVHGMRMPGRADGADE